MITRKILTIVLLALLVSVGVVTAADGAEAESATVNKLLVNADAGKEIINRNIYGHFAEHLGRCIYEGIWVGQDSPIPNTRGIRTDIVEALKKIKIPVLRWPGGYFADEYRWKDGIGPRQKRPTMVNTHWGKVTENNHCDRVKMANIAQTVNVLQAMVLTKGEKMILTPTYHVFEMYTVHHDATLLPIELQCNDYKFGEKTIPALNASASQDKSGSIHISICNLDPKKDAELICELKGAKGRKVTGRILTDDDINAHNTFENPEFIKPAVFEGAKIKGDSLTVTLPAKSVVVLEIR